MRKLHASTGYVACPHSACALHAAEALGLGDPLIGRILTVDTTEMEFRVFNLKPDPLNAVTYDNRDKIEIRELEGLCAPSLAH